jgi:23S rRNA-/tRNA-specific pseudouridylate synthase
MIDLALGLVVLAKSPEVAAKYSKQLVEHKFHKVTPLEHHWNTTGTLL